MVSSVQIQQLLAFPLPNPLQYVPAAQSLHWGEVTPETRVNDTTWRAREHTWAKKNIWSSPSSYFLLCYEGVKGRASAQSLMYGKRIFNLKNFRDTTRPQLCWRPEAVEYDPAPQTMHWDFPVAPDARKYYKQEG